MKELSLERKVSEDEEIVEIRRPLDFGPDCEVKFDKQLFLAEYSSLRQEILQRLAQQTQITQIALTAWGVILAYALPKSDVLAILVYPLLAYFIAFGWAFNNTRIFQIARYLRCREKDVTDVWGLIYWENHVWTNHLNDPRSVSLFSLHPSARVRPGLAVFAGTQGTTLIMVMIIVWKQGLFLLTPNPSSSQIFMLLFFLLDFLVTLRTYQTLCASESEGQVPDNCEKLNLLPVG